jgi:hypothetical protein
MLAASLASGTPVDLRDAVTSLDDRNLKPYLRYPPRKRKAAEAHKKADERASEMTAV